jgi:hypothetical protein
MPLTRKQIANIYRPQSGKIIAQNLSFTPGAGSTIIVAGNQIDLSVPLVGFRCVMKFRDVIGTASMTTANPLGYLNLLRRVYIYGRNARAAGNMTLWDLDLPNIILYEAAFMQKPFQYNGVSSVGAASAGTEVAIGQPGTPVTGFLNGTTGTYDIRIAFDLPAYPFEVAKAARIGYVLRSQEWADTLQMRFEFPQVSSGVTNPLGTDAGTTTHTFTSFGSGSGTPTFDIYGLPAPMGIDLDASHLPGLISRIGLPLTSVLQSAGGANTRLVTLEKQHTTRMVVTVGTSTVTPHMASLSDTNLSTLGMLIGGNRVIRENDDIFQHKQEVVWHYPAVVPVQGVIPFDFLESENPDSHYDAGDAGEGTTLEIRGTVAGVGSAYGTVVQEIERFSPSGGLYLQ